MARIAFCRDQRLNRAEDYNLVFRCPEYQLTLGCMRCLARRNGQPYARLGLVVSKKVFRLATQRNRFKRVVREYFRTHCADLPGLDIVVLARPGLTDLNSPQFREQLGRLWIRMVEKVHAPSGD